MRREDQTSPLGGRNRKGAGAPRGNRNALGSRVLRQHVRLKNHILAGRLRLLVLAAAITHFERRLVSQNTARTAWRDLAFAKNNFVVEASAMRRGRRPEDRQSA